MIANIDHSLASHPNTSTIRSHHSILTPRALRVMVEHDLCINDLSIALEVSAKLSIIHTRRQPADEDL